MKKFKGSAWYKSLRVTGKKLRTSSVARYSPLRLLKKWLAEAFRKTLFRRKLRNATPVFVAQMGKVGSRSIAEPLEKDYAGVVLHGHLLDRMGWQMQYLLDWSRQGHPLKIISPVRDPISRNVSAFFHFIEGRVGQASDKSNLPVNELVDLFINYRDDNEDPNNMAMMDHDLPLNWFDDNIKKHFDIDVYATPFPESGHIRLSNNNADILVFRIELSDEQKETLIREFLGLSSFKLKNTNVGSTKGYSVKYKEFKNKAQLPETYLNKMRDSKYFRHFYSKEEIDKLCDKWSIK